MKKIAILILILSLIASFPGCNRNSDNPQGKIGKQDKTGSHPKGEKGKNGDANNAIPMTADGKIDVDKLDIPDRMKKAIKSGRIPMSRVKQFLERKNSNAPLVKIQRTKRQKINSFLVLNGSVEPERKVEVYSRLSAYVKKILCEEGDRVKKDSVLALLDDTEIGISYRQAQLQLQQAKLTMDDEEANLKRSKKLFDTKMISEQEFQVARANFNKAKLDHKNNEESFKDLALQLSYTKITSPVDGFVTLRSIEVGTRVTSNQQVYTVEDFSPLLVKVYIPASDIINLEKGLKTEISTNVLTGLIFDGKIKLINPRIDVQTGTVKVTIEVYDVSGKLKPGMFVETKILVRNNPNALVIPKKCISYKNNKAFVFAYNRKDMVVNKKEITTGITENDNIEVTAGLDENVPIVCVGVEGLKDDMKVKVDMAGSHRRGKNQGPPPHMKSNKDSSPEKKHADWEEKKKNKQDKQDKHRGSSEK
ncbi:MAG: efflux RND transporter periplasmic adaptor subunit [bacterium]|nr:efflux RND transporter periplasmic adaptor subunit [bacterium]